MVQIAATLVATTLFVSSALASNPQYYRRESFTESDILDRELTEPVTREDLELMFQRSLEMADSLEDREPFLGAIFGAVRGISAAVRGIRAAKKAGSAAHRAHQHHQNHKNRRHRRELEEREINDELYNELD